MGSSFWTGTPVGTSSSIGQRVVVLDTAAEGGGGGGGGDITTSGSPARSQSNLQRILSGWSPPEHQRDLFLNIRGEILSYRSDGTVDSDVSFSIAIAL